MIWLLIGCSATWEAIDGDGDGVSILEGDCDDTDPAVSTGANQLWYADSDGDGIGDPAVQAIGCSAPDGYVADDRDCDDSRLDIYPGATELCDGLDNDCDGLIDDDPADPIISFFDGDSDGFGDGTASTARCEVPPGYVTDDTDCDDTEPLVFPGSTAAEVPFDGLDTDCDGRDYCTDLSCDGRPDVVLVELFDGSSWQQQVRIVYGEGELLGASPTLLSGERLTDAAVGDFNGDGYLDIAAASAVNLSDSILSPVFWGSSDGHSDSARELLAAPGAEAVLAEDLNGDGLPELIFASHSRSDGGVLSYETDAVIYWATPDGFLITPPTLLPAAGALAVAAADLSGDGALDVVLCNHRDNTPEAFNVSSTIYWGGDFRDVTELPVSGCRGLDIADLDGDGDLDLAFASYRDGTSSASSSRVYWSDGGSFSSASVTELPTVAAFSVQAVDLDVDGFPELVFGSLLDDVAGNAYSTSTRIYWGSEQGYSVDAVSELDAAASERPLLTDLNRDGFPELIAPGYAAGVSDFTPESLIYWGSAAGPSAADVTALSTQNAHHVAAGDLDGDGFPELVFGSFYSGDGHSTQSRVCWGSGGGYDDDEVQLLSTIGVWAAPLIVGP